ncbi:MULTISPECIES: RyR domain-containing protein [unclassified Cryobacterium]|uniref:RyR domain-containing protein n=1 Tax=unclassified Cryobacterium TaxID=2649013 RepID=UPI002AB33AF7|nr:MULTISPECIES: RyR domain-containing protein [unclassified Cryobacterium]MDY7542615.1 RyR domain-containing protein [Cryobacterium sp. 5B3]MEB0264735.1 RyR domain-containing protein [Cryobacterium sp. 10I5]MEB0273707.1 RyR domain-containing protein [Cryobacterium sp. 5B3]
MNLEAIAAVCHDANRRLQILQGDAAPSQPWDTAEQWQRDSAIEGVQAAIDGATPRELHESWCAFKVADGWTFGEVKDAGEKTHPCLVDYDDLPAEQRTKDDLFTAIVLALHQ